MAQTPLTVGSPQQVIERTLGFREIVGDYQRQLFLVDHAGLPLPCVLEQMEMLGELVVPVLRRRVRKNRPPEVPDRARPSRAVAAGAGRSRGGARERRAAAAGALPRPLVVVTAGAERAVLDTAARRPALGRLRAASPRTRAFQPSIRVVELREHAQDLVNHLLTGFPSPALQPRSMRVSAPTADRRQPDLQRVLQRPLQAVLRRDREGRLAGMPALLAATGGTRATRSRSTTRCGRCSPT
jgi:hypothetical protein